MAERAVRPEGSWTIVWACSGASWAHVCATMCESILINWKFAVCASDLGICEFGRSLWVTWCRFSRYSVGRGVGQGGEIGARVKLTGVVEVEVKVLS